MKLFLNTSNINKPTIEITETKKVNTQEHTEFLNDLRESGVTNMFGAGKWLQEEFGLEKREAREILATWMQNFEKE